MNWLYRNKILTKIPDEAHSFVYKITNKENGKIYIGKKHFYSMRTKRVIINGKVKKKKVVKESDWKKYFGSCEALKQDVKELGPENFHREILHLCTNRGSASYYELVEQVKHKVLEKENCYNGHINIHIHRKHIQRPMILRQKDIR